jgi:uncharacterized membrane protein YhiD involved in acid resistance
MEQEIIQRLLIETGVGAIIDIECQWNNCIARLRMNVLVAVGAGLFGSLKALTPGNNTPNKSVF